MLLNEDLFEDIEEEDIIENDIISDDELSSEDEIVIDDDEEFIEDEEDNDEEEVVEQGDVTTWIRDQISTELSLNNVYEDLKKKISDSDVEHPERYAEIIDNIIADHAFIVGKLQGLLSGVSPEETEKIEDSADDTKEQLSQDLKDLLKKQEEMPVAMEVTDDDVSFMSDDFAVSDGIIHDDSF